MSVNVRVPGKDTSNIKSFSVQEDATPIDPSSSSGGVGQIVVGMDDFPDAPRLIGDLILTDGSRGKTSGTIRTVGASDGALTLTADSALGMFNTDRTVAPHVGTLGTAIQFYCDLVGIQNDVFVDSDISSRAVTYPGWTGNVWVGIKQIMAKEQIEMALVFDRISVRSLRKLTVNQDRKTTDGLSVDNNNAAQSVEVYYYNHTYGTQREVFPLRGESQQPSFTVNAGETITVTQQLNASMISVNQPLVQDFVANTSFEGTNGVYSVVGNDGLPVTAAQWTAQGGALSVRITDNPSIIEISVTGPNNRGLAPYRIGMSSGGSNIYNSLHVTGTAVVWDKQLLTLNTGVPSSQTSVEVGATVDNPFISTLSDAYNAGVWAAASHAGLNYTVSGSAFNVNRAGQGRDLIQATISDFNTAYPYGTLISAFNTMWSGQTISDFNDYWLDQVDLLWENQLFGNVTGARVINPDANFRVVSATTTESSVQYSAALDTVVGDFNSEWYGASATTVTTNIFPDPATTSVTAFETNAGMIAISSIPGFGVSTTAIRATRVGAGAARLSGVVGTAFLASTPYTLVVTVNASAPLSGVAVNYRPNVTSSTGQVTAGTVNIPAGISQVRLTATRSANAASALTGVSFVWSSGATGTTFDITDIAVVQDTYTGESFHGSMTDTHSMGVTTNYDWVGTPNASSSTRTVITGLYLVSDFNDQFAGMTMKDFNVIPLRKDY